MFREERNVDRFYQLLARIEPADRTWQQQAWERLHSQIRPRGSLGLLENIAARLAGMRQSLTFDLSRKLIFTMAGDHGVAAEGVSAYPQEVTPQMVLQLCPGVGLHQRAGPPRRG